MQLRNLGKAFALSLLVPMLLVACGGGASSEPGDDGDTGSGEEEPPTAELDAAPRSGVAPLAVSFTDLSSGTVDTWSWSFGDGASSSAQNPAHTYDLPGTYVVTLTVSGPGGSSSATLAGDIVVDSEPGVECEAGDATTNTSFPLLSETYDFVPVTSDGRGFWCVYSVRNVPGGSPGVGNNVGIFLFEIDGARVLVFGAGYGEILYNGEGPLFNAAFDMAMVDAVIQGCMGRDPGTTTVLFVAPHGHGDHVNAAAIRELRTLNYAVSDIYYHIDDEGAVSSLEDWTSQDFAIFRPLDGNACTDELLGMSADLGWLWFLSRPGHTAGSIDLVIDVDSNTNDRVVVYGSAASNTCGGNPTGTRFAVRAHGNVMVP